MVFGARLLYAVMEFKGSISHAQHYQFFCFGFSIINRMIKVSQVQIRKLKIEITDYNSIGKSFRQNITHIDQLLDPL